MSGARIGQEIAGKYRVVRLLGEGGMGAVYEAQHTLIGRRFAIKFVHPDLAASPDILARFRREAQAAGSLESENIAAVTDFGLAEDGAPYIVMEYLTGEDLARILSRDGPMPVPRLLDIVIQACRGLHAAHAAGIVHRDLKPENLFIVRRGDGSDLVKVLDFGIAKLRTTEDATSTTRTGTTMGTPFYMPPEQARGEKGIDHRADVYALGVILYEALAGTKPHPGDSYNAILYHILSKPPAPLEGLRPRLPAGLAHVVHRALAFEANDRYASVSELTAALTPYVGHAVAPMKARGPVQGPASSNAVTVETPPSLVRTPSPGEAATMPADGTQSKALAVPLDRGSARLLGGLALAVVVIGGGAMLFSTGKEHGDLPVTSTSGQASVVAAAAPEPTATPATPAAPSAPPVIASADPTPAPSERTPPPSTQRIPLRPAAPASRAPAPAPAPPPPTAQHPSVAAFGAPPVPTPASSAKRGGRPLNFDKSNPYGP